MPSTPDLIGRETPRIFTPQLRPLTPETSWGFSVIEFATDMLGIDLMPWQQWLLIHALERNPDGTPRFRTVLVLVARQNGKSTLLQVLSLYMLFVAQVTLVLGTAQDLDTAEDLWADTVSMAEAVDELAAGIQAVVRTNGKKSMDLEGDKRYKVKAASRKAGRGRAGDLILLDELREHQKWDAWGAITKTTMARRDAQVWCTSNAGDGKSIVLARLRRIAHARLGDPDGICEGLTVEADDSLGIFEWSALPGCDIRDRAAWAQANPSLGHTITERAIRSAAATDPDDVFRTEVLCQWVDRMADSPDELNPTTWAACEDIDAAPESGLVLGLDVAPWQASASIVVCGADEDGRPVVELVERRRRTGWVVARLQELVERHGQMVVVIDPAGPVGSMLAELDEAGLDIVELSGREAGRAITTMTFAVSGAVVAHRGDPLMAAAVAGAELRKSGDSTRWSRTDSEVDISPIVAATWAYWQWSQDAAADYDVSESAY